MKKRLFLSLLMICLLLGAVAPAAYATETVESTETTEATEAATEETIDPTRCGENLTWSFSGGTLTISGTGAMDDMSGGAPWAAHKKEITTVVFTGGVTTVGAQAFRDYDSITSIDFGGSMREIDTQAFQNCDGLKSISLPSTFRRFGMECFQGCSNLTEVHCAGSMPSFNANCLWNGNFVTVYCPTNNIWPESYVQELETNFGGRLQILAEDGSDPFDFDEPEETTKATTAPTEETTAPTEESTVPTTEAETEPVTEESTVPETEETEPTVTETEEITQESAEETGPEKPEKKRVSGAVIAAVIVMVVSAVGIGVILFLLKNNKGGKYAA